jgi:hypothetical protein
MFLGHHARVAGVWDIGLCGNGRSVWRRWQHGPAVCFVLAAWMATFWPAVAPMTPVIDALTVVERAWLIGIAVMAVSALMMGFVLLNAVMEIDKAQPRDRRPDAIT